MMQLRVVLFFLFITSIWSCQSGSGQNQESEDYTRYYDSVMVIHDRTMPLMSTIDQLREQLKEIKESAEEDSASDITNINRLMGELNKGEDAMYDWMHKFKPDAVPEEEKLRYIQNELYSIKRMEDIMMDGIHQSQEFLEAAGKQE